MTTKLLPIEARGLPITSHLTGGNVVDSSAPLAFAGDRGAIA